MYRIDNVSAADGPPPPTTALGKAEGYFQGGNPSVGLEATIVEAEWLNMIQEEGANLVLSTGTPLDKADRSQWSKAVDSKIAAGIAAIADDFVLKAGDTMTGNLSMVGAGVAVNYQAPTTLLFGPWQPLGIGFGWDGTNLRIKVDDLDVGAIDPAGAATRTWVTIGDVPPAAPAVADLWWHSIDANMFIWYDDGTSQQWVPATSSAGGGGGLTVADADLRYVNVVGDTMTGELIMAGTGIGIRYAPPTTLLFGPWEAVAGTPDNIAFGFDGANLRVRANDVDVGALKPNAGVPGFSFVFQQLIPGGTPAGTTYTFTIPAADMPSGSFYWHIVYDQVGSSNNTFVIFAMNGLEGYQATNFDSVCNCWVDVLVDVNDGLGLAWKGLGRTHMAGLDYALNAQHVNFATVPPTAPLGVTNLMLHTAGDDLQFRLVVNDNANLINDDMVTINFGGVIIAPFPLVVSTSTATGFIDLPPTINVLPDDRPNRPRG